MDALQSQKTKSLFARTQRRQHHRQKTRLTITPEVLQAKLKLKDLKAKPSSSPNTTINPSSSSPKT